MEGPTELYQHDELQFPSQEIRLLILAPALEFQADLQCSLARVKLSDKPKYEALSYAWGSTADFLPLTCDGKLLWIPQNLATALRYCRKSKTPRRMWADAVCVNQTNLSEKTQQIELMGAIYSKALHTLIWLGEAKSLVSESTIAVKRESTVAREPEKAVESLFQSLRAFHMVLAFEDRMFQMTKFWEGLQRGLRDSIRGYITPRSSFAGKRNVASRLLKRRLQRRDPYHEITWQLLLSRPWFRRVWTLQELLLSPSPILLCGSSHVPALAFSCAAESYSFDGYAEFARQRVDLWTYFSSRLMKLLIGSSKEVEQPYCDEQPYGDVQHAYGTRREKLLFLTLLLSVVCSSAATNPSDNVIGSLAILEMFGVQPPAPDYSCSVAELYTRATRSLFRFCNNLSLLTLICEQSPLEIGSEDNTNDHSTSRGTPRLPSWALDWSRSWNMDEQARLFYVTHVICGIGTSAYGKATRHSLFEDWSGVGSADELVLAGCLPANTPHYCQYVTSCVPSQESSKSTTNRTWAKWVLVLRGAFGTSARDQTWSRLAEAMSLLVPASVDIGTEFEVMWRLASDIVNRSTGRLWDDVDELVSRPEFQRLTSPSDSMSRTKLEDVAKHLKHLTLIVTNTGAIGFSGTRSSEDGQDSDQNSARHFDQNESRDFDQEGTMQRKSETNNIGSSFPCKTDHGNGYRDSDHAKRHSLTDLTGCVVALVAGLDYPLLLWPASPDFRRFYLRSVAVLSGMMQGEMWPLDRDDLHQVVLI